MEDCVFCKIIKGEIPCYKIYEDDFTLAFLDISREHFGHTLVVPKKHFKNILDCDEKYLQKVALAVQKISKHYITDCGFKGVNILNANGEEAQQSVFHLHFHIIPRQNKNEIDIFPHKDKVKEELCEQMKKLKMY